MKSNLVIEKLMENSKIKNIGLKQDSLLNILNTYEDIIVDILLENGRIELSNGMIIEVVKLLDRVHVLRGVSYKSSRRYKLKLTMEEKIYKRIEEYYDKLQEEID